MNSAPETTAANPPRLLIEKMMHRQSIAVPGESAASYALVKLIPTGGAGSGLGLDLAIALDVSGSMYEEDGVEKSRLRRIQEAALAAIEKLRPTDRIALVAFGHDAQVLLPLTPLSERGSVEQVIRDLERCPVDPTGTVMDQGIDLALQQVLPAKAGNRLAQLLVLTDGETSGESACRELAQKAGREGVRFTVMGVGTEWNGALIKDLARLSEGRWDYIDASAPDEALRVFLAEFDRLADAAFTRVEMEIRPVKDVRVKRVRQVVPEIHELPVTTVEERKLTVPLGTLERSHSTRYVLDLSLPRRPDGKYVVAQVEVRYDLGNGQMQSTGAVPLEVTYTAAGNGYVNAEVARHIDEVQIYELNSNLQQAIGSENADEVQRVAEQIVRKGEVLGKRAAKKTQLAVQVLDELKTGGRVSKKTQLAVDDAARDAEEPPPA